MSLPLDVSVSAFLLFLTDWKTPPTPGTHARNNFIRQQADELFFSVCTNIEYCLNVNKIKHMNFFDYLLHINTFVK